MKFDGSCHSTRRNRLSIDRFSYEMIFNSFECLHLRNVIKRRPFLYVYVNCINQTADEFHFAEEVSARTTNDPLPLYGSSGRKQENCIVILFVKIRLHSNLLFRIFNFSDSNRRHNKKLEAVDTARFSSNSIILCTSQPFHLQHFSL